MPKPAATTPRGQQHDRRPDHVQHCDDQRRPCRTPNCGTATSPASRLLHSIVCRPASQASATLRELDRQITQIERVTDAQEADDQHPLHLVRRQAERMFFHRANMIRICWPDNPESGPPTGCISVKRQNRTSTALEAEAEAEVGAAPVLRRSLISGYAVATRALTSAFLS